MTRREPGRVARILRARPLHVAAGVATVTALAALSILAASTPSSNSGYVAAITNSTDQASTALYFTCSAAATADKAASTAIFQWALNDSTLGTGLFGTTPDASNNANPGNYRSTLNAYSTTTPIACPRDGGNALVFNGNAISLGNPLGTNGTYLSSTKTTAATTTSNVSVEAWFKTSTAGGKIIGLGGSATGSSGAYDRHLYVDSGGKLVFGTYNGGYQTLSTASAVTDGKWHLAVGTLSTTAGMVLYLDGVQVAASSAFTSAENDTGYWRVGYDNLGGWPNAPSNYYFTGQMRYVAAYSSVLTATQVKNDYLAGLPQ